MRKLERYLRRNIGKLIIAVFLVSMLAGLVLAQEVGERGPAPAAEGTAKAGIAVGAALAVGLAAVGAGIGISGTGAAALGAMVERREAATWGLIFAALAEGLALYGFVVAFLLIGRM